MKYVEIHEDLLERKIRVGEYEYVCYCNEIQEYMLVVIITWVAWYPRYYWISKEDYELAQTNLEAFKEKYKEAFDSAMELPRGITAMGSSALRDYEMRQDFRPQFKHFLYEDKVLYAHIVVDGIHYAVLPYRIIKDENGEYIRPLEKDPRAKYIYMKNSDGEEVNTFMAIEIEENEIEIENREAYDKIMNEL